MFTKVFIGSDHAGVDLKNKIISTLNQEIISFDDVIVEGDYTDIAHKVALLVSQNSDSCGILICGSGVGVSITANRIVGIRASLCHSQEVAKLSRNHNNANVLCLGSRIIPEEEQIEIIKTFLNSQFDGGRHSIRVNKIDSLS